MSSEAVFAFGGHSGKSWVENSLSSSAPSSPATCTPSAVTMRVSTCSILATCRSSGVNGGARNHPSEPLQSERCGHTAAAYLSCVAVS